MAYDVERGASSVGTHPHLRPDPKPSPSPSPNPNPNPSSSPSPNPNRNPNPNQVGTHVRDAACYVCWAFARAFEL